MTNNVSQPAAPPKPSKMLLTNVNRGILHKPIRVLLFSTEGLGKTTWASRAPSPIYIGTEDGTSNVDVARFPEPTAWSDVFDALHVLTHDAHEFKTVVFDTVDWLEPLCWQAVCARAKIASIEDLNFGKGYTAALDEWRLLLVRLEKLRATKAMHVILLAHAWVKSFKNPEGDDFDRYELKLHAKSGGLLKEWVDAVLFGNYETFTHKTKQDRIKGMDSGARVVHTQRRAAWDAKNRYDLPETMPLDWEIFAEHVASHRPGEPAHIRKRIAQVLAESPTLSADVAAKVRASAEKAGEDAAELARIADKLTGMVQTTENPQ